ncbi:MAG: IMP dehydrogenase [Candidatus Neomarinimicrobiota bacterium]
MAKERDFRKALTFDDVLLVPSKSEVVPRDVGVSTRLTRRIGLEIPIISAAMDTVTEADMAIAMAREGGLGVLHKAMSIERQAREVVKVKRAESGVILNPVTFSPDRSIREAIVVMKEHNISGLPIVDDDNNLLGILTERDTRFETNLDQSVHNCMTRENLVTASKDTTLDKAKEILQKHRIEKLLLVEGNGKLAGMVTVRDILMKQQHPKATLDRHGRLRVGAAIGVTEDILDRAAALIDSGVDILFLDSAHGHSKGVLDSLEKVKKEYASVSIIAGNVASSEGAKALVDSGSDAVKVGIGAGASCTTRVVAGIGVPQLTAIIDCREVTSAENIPLISDGGIRYSGDIAKAVAAGADCVMLGGLLAGLDESPGEVIHYEGRQYKSFRGMGSLGTMRQGSADRYFQEGEEIIKMVPEGVEGMVPYRGSVRSATYQLVGGLRTGMGYCGAANISEMQTKTRFIQISPSSYREGHPHDVKIIKASPNYQVLDRINDVG